MVRFSLLLALLLPATSAIYAADKSITDLLSDYRVASDLSNQTKKEAGGSVIVYSRDQLERMQAYSLRDVLKTIPLFTLQEAMTGPVNLAKATGATFNSQYIKFYINDHELGSAVYGSAMKMWGYMDISHIDHIEVYQTGSSVSAGDEPPGMVIKLYTKDPGRDKGSQIQTIQSSRGGAEYNAYHAGVSNDLSYFVYLNKKQENRDTYRLGTTDIKRDYDSTNFFGALNGKDYKINIAQLHLDHDGFFGIGKQKQVEENYASLKHQYVTFTQYFQNKSLTFKASYDRSNAVRYDSDTSGISLVNASGTLFNANTWYYDKDETIMNTALSKKFTLDEHDFEFGIQGKRKEYDPVSVKVDGTEYTNTVSDYRKLDIYSVYLTDNYSFNEKNLMLFTIKYDYHSRDGDMKNTDNYVFRLGYIYNDETWLWKTFAIHTYGYPVFIQNSYFPFIYQQNTALKDEDRYAATTELHYKTKNTTTGVRYLYNTVKNGIVITPASPPSTPATYVNNSVSPKFHAVYASHEYRFDQHNKLLLSAYTAYNDQSVTMSSKKGYMLQLFNRFGRFDLYNELIYKSAYQYTTSTTPSVSVDVPDGYDYTAGVSYHMTKDLTLSIKAENIFQKAIKTPYPIPARGTTEYLAPFDRTIRAGLKYVF